ncbi:MAG TPA: CPBP family intramembrane glutamic endopeptidase [Terriglobales bacterium]|nr:CPBP family intramembrane glutamic endopeptidase [Terriglobales bacterium]
MNNETDGQPLNNNATLTPAEPIPPAQPSTLHKIFIGKDGLRAGWSLLIFIAIFAVIAFCANRIGHKLHPPAPKTGNAPTEISPSFGYIAELIPLLITVLVTWIMSKIERRPNSVYGFGDSRMLPHFFAGMAWGIACLSLLILTLWKSGLLVFDGRLLFGRDVLRYGAIWLFGFFLVGLLEEYLTRGYILYTLSRGLAGSYQWAFKTRHSAALGFWTSAVILSLLFGLGHKSNPGESPIGLLSAGLASMVFCLSLWRTGSLWWAIGLHTSWDWGQSFLYGVPDSGLMVQHHLFATNPVGKPILSGGTTGPEGSIFIIAVLALIAVIILFTLPKGHYGRASRAFEIGPPTA